MQELIEKIYDVLKDYRADEGSNEVIMSPERIQIWVEQFEEVDREFILKELLQIFPKRYCNKKSAKSFLRSVLETLTKDFKYSSVKDFLSNANFLDLQPEGKSQKIMLNLLNEVLVEEYQISDFTNKATQVKHYIYLDDILCTGNTLINDLKEWCEQNYSDSKTIKEAITDGTVNLSCVFIFLHVKNYHKKKAEMRHKICEGISQKHLIYFGLGIQNDNKKEDSALDFLLPLEESQPQIVEEYKNKIKNQVEKYTQDAYGYVGQDEFFRVEGLPKEEKLFTSLENRARFENIMLKKGIEILNNSNITKKNIRALGFSLPGQKDFGFGTLCFTWRNIANNAPLVFWYSGGGFIPLFIKNQTNS